MSADVAPEEAEAVRLLWAKEGGQGEVPAEEFDRLLAQIRERKALIESHVVKDMLIRKIGEGRRYPRRHMQVGLAAFVIMGGIVLIVWSIVSLLR